MRKIIQTMPAPAVPVAVFVAPPRIASEKRSATLLPPRTELGTSFPDLRMT